MKYFDQHVHTYYSRDSEETFENYIQSAKQLGLDTLVFTDHCDFDWMHIDLWYYDIEKHFKECEEMSKKYPEIKVYPGIEIGYVPEKYDEINKIIKSHKFNVINLSLHVIDNYDLYFFPPYEEYGVDNLLNLYFDRLYEMIDKMDDFDTLSHFDYGFKTVKRSIPTYQISMFEDKVKKIMSLLIKKEKALEINMKVQRGINDFSHLRYVLKLYKSLGGKYLTLSSDAHRAEKLCNSFDEIFPILKEEGFDELTCFIDRKKFLVKI